MRATWVAPRPAAEDRPKVTGAAAAAAAIWMARAMSWAITAHLANSTRYAQDSRTFAMRKAASAALRRYPSWPPPPSNFSYVLVNLSIDSPALCAVTVRALLLALVWSSVTFSPNCRHMTAQSLSLSSFAVGHL